MKVTTKDRRVVTLKNYEMTEKHELEFSDSVDLENEATIVINKMDDISSLNYTNENHEKIYNNNKAKIIPFVKKG